MRYSVISLGIVACLFLFFSASNLSFLQPEQKIQSELLSVTNPEIATNNLNSQIRSLEKLLAEKGDHSVFQAKLFDLLQTRAQFFGTYKEDFARLKSLVPAEPKGEGEFFLAAKYHSMLHNFDEALGYLEQIPAEKAGPKVRALKQRILLALGRSLSELRSEESSPESFSEFVFAANIEAELGNFEKADIYFSKALESYTDSSPFAPAFLAFRRGVMWGEQAGNVALARKYYEEALHYLPGYVVATVHLAEILNEGGEREKAITLLERVSGSFDPEPAGLLGELLVEAGDTEGGQRWIAEAKEKYEELLASYPLAFADHGSEFFQGPGSDPVRGLQLALKNLENRENQRAYQVAIEAANVAGRVEVARELIEKATALKPTSVPLKELLGEVSG